MDIQLERIQTKDNAPNSMKLYSSSNRESQAIDFFFDEITREFCCNTCSFKSKHKYGMNRHLRTHFKPYECEIYKSSFARSDQLKSRKSTHTRTKPHKCEVCDSSYANFSALKIHMRMHTGERPYKCNVCSSSFSESTKVKIHMRTHTGCSEVYIKGIVNLVKEALKTTFEFVGPAEGILNLLGTPCSVLSG